MPKRKTQKNAIRINSPPRAGISLENASKTSERDGQTDVSH